MQNVQTSQHATGLCRALGKLSVCNYSNCQDMENAINDVFNDTALDGTAIIAVAF